MPDTLRPNALDALQAWRERVRANREQAERLREGEPPRDFYATVASDFRANPRRTDEPALDLLRAFVAQGGERAVDKFFGFGAHPDPRVVTH